MTLVKEIEPTYRSNILEKKEGDEKLQTSLQHLDEVTFRLQELIPTEQHSSLEVAYNLAIKRTQFYFDHYDGNADLPVQDLDYSFVIHTRDSVSAIQAGYCYHDALAQYDEFVPFLEYIEGDVELQLLFHALNNSLPPRVLAVTQVRADGNLVNGAIVLLPVDLDSDQAEGSRVQLVKQVRAGIHPAIQDFVVNRLGTTKIGLGAILPSVTQKGKSIQKFLSKSGLPEIKTTTGHAATLRLMHDTFIAGAQEKNINLHTEPIYIVGCGAIGTAITQMLVEKNSAPNSRFVLVDSNQTNAAALQEFLVGAGVVSDCITPELFQQRILDNEVSAVICATDSLQPNSYKGWKNIALILDDSQPVQWWRRTLLEMMSLCWPIGTVSKEVYSRQSLSFVEDDDQPHLLQTMNFGVGGNVIETEEELSVFGCEIEIAALVLYGYMHLLSISHSPTLEDIEKIGDLLNLLGMQTGHVLQSFGYRSN